MRRFFALQTFFLIWEHNRQALSYSTPRKRISVYFFSVPCIQQKQIMNECLARALLIQMREEGWCITDYCLCNLLPPLDWKSCPAFFLQVPEPLFRDTVPSAVPNWSSPSSFPETPIYLLFPWLWICSHRKWTKHWHRIFPHCPV